MAGPTYMHPPVTPTFCHAFGVLSLLHSCSSEVKPRTPGLKGASEMMRCTSPGVDGACHTADFSCSCNECERCTLPSAVGSAIVPNRTSSRPVYVITNATHHGRRCLAGPQRLRRRPWRGACNPGTSVWPPPDAIASVTHDSTAHDHSWSSAESRASARCSRIRDTRSCIYL